MSSTAPLLVRVVPAAGWSAVEGDIPLDPDGFVHLCTPAQVAGVCERFHAETEGLVLLGVDQGLLGDALRWEDTHGHGELFPHLYAPLPRASIVSEVPYGRDGDGRFPEVGADLQVVAP